jgi:UPF0176 protein
MNNNSRLADFLLPDTPFFISTFYQFVKVADPEKTKQTLMEKAQELQILGLIILGQEGFNTTCSSQSQESLNQWKEFIKTHFNISQLNEKNSKSDKPPFLRFSIKIRDEIVTTGRTDLYLPTEKQNHNHHLTPEEWDQVMEQERDNIVIIDTRNWYEYEIGSFNSALNPNIEKFTEFPRHFQEQNISPDKKILIFCTGGIRCEKGILELQEKGYKNVFQLEGGILNYFEKRPHRNFWGECFVFDNRVAVTQELKPSEKYTLCPHCGQPASLKKDCLRCDTEFQICEKCSILENKKDTCSKNCSFQWDRFKKKGARQEPPYSQVIKKFKNT